MRKMSILNVKDNVGTVTVKIYAGETLEYDVNGELAKVEVIEDIPLGHKIALKDFQDGEDIIKYGEVIGRANQEIKQGALVHIQNVESLRGRGDLTKEAQKLC